MTAPSPPWTDPADVRRTLAEFMGWRPWEGYFLSPDRVVRFPDADLRDMAMVEAELKRRGLAATYLWHLGRALCPGRGSVADGWDYHDLFAAVTAPAAVRALAAYRVVSAAGGLGETAPGPTATPGREQARRPAGGEGKA